MIRRYFLWHILLGWLLAIGQKNGVFAGSKSMANLFEMNSSSDRSRSLSDFQGELDSDTQTATTAGQNKPIVFFVATDGNDTWSGRQASPNASKNDGPFATWKRVQQAIRKTRQKSAPLNRPIKVIFGGGTYYLSEPIIFTPEDSGTKLSPVIYQAAPKQQVTISGGKAIARWQEQQVNGMRLWTAQLPKDLQGVDFQHLWVNNKRRVRARYPSKGYLRVKSAPRRKGQHWHEGDRSLEYKAADIPPELSLEGGQAVVMSRWVESRLPITEVDRQQHTISFAKESVFKIVPDDYYYLENSRAFLDTPGEWYLDKKANRLYYLPLANEAIATTEVIAPILDGWLKFMGHASKNSTISYLRFKDLMFAHTDWHLPPGVYVSGYNHNAWGVAGAIVGNGIVNCHWERCTIKHTGGYGFELLRGCRDNRIVGCSIYDLGAGAIKIGERKTFVPKIPLEDVSHHNTISHNHISGGGKFFPSAVAIRTVYTHNNLIAHNHVHDFYYTGIAVRGIWGFESTQAYENIIEYNHVHHIGKLGNGDGPIISDMGGIYNLGNQPGTVIRHNKVHDVYGLRYGGWGIYLDEGSSQLVVENNLVYNTGDGGFCQHYGRDNMIRQNIFAFGSTAQLYRNKRDLKTAREQNIVSFYFVNNIVYWQEGDFLAGLKANYQTNAVFKDNIYWKTTNSNFMLGDRSWKRWRESDRDSIIADPLFVAPQQGNFQLQPNSPALQLGIIDRR